jgi:LysM repeat protein
MAGSFNLGGMTLRAWFFRCALAAILWLNLSGCSPSDQSQLEDEKEPHYLQGKSRENQMDYQGAIESYEKAVEVNPHSAAAHLALGLLYEKDETNAAAAIYHFDQYLKFRHNPDNADVINQHILACKQEVARTVLLGPATQDMQRVTENMQRQLEQLAEDNKRLKEEADRWRAYYAGHPPIPTNAPVQVQVLVVTNRVPAPAPPAPANRQPGVASSARTYTVRDGDTFSAISRKYGVKVDVLIAANAGTDPKRLRVGQSLNIPLP